MGMKARKGSTCDALREGAAWESRMKAGGEILTYTEVGMC
jgi:hypothetical protein